MHNRRQSSLMRLAVSLLGAASLTAAAPVSSNFSGPGNSTRSNNACARISAAYAKLPKNAIAFDIPGDIAYECVRSMPFKSDLGVAFVDEYAKYIQWQSTVENLKNPPSDYLSPAVDLVGGLEEIRQKAADNKYTSQFDFDTDLWTLVTSAADGHFAIYPCSYSIFSWSGFTQLVSASEDGLKAPALFTYLDSQILANGSTDISPVVKIDGVDAAKYLDENVAWRTNSQDPDARYNNLFPSYASLLAGGSARGIFSQPGVWPGTAVHTLTYANGTTSKTESYTSWNGKLPFNYTSGEALFEKFCLPKASSSSGSSSSSSSSQERAIAAPLKSGAVGYPEPVMRNPYNYILGYFLDVKDVEDVAILQIPTFEVAAGGDGPNGGVLPDNVTTVFAQNAINFINSAVKAGKEKIIIDLSANGGGDIVQGFNLFKIFYPDQPAYSATRFRTHELVDLLGQAYSNAANVNPDAVKGIPLVWQNQVAPDQKSDFSSWADLYGPEEVFGANMSSLYANFNFSSTSRESDPISGYGGVELNPTKQPFKTENILMLTDGVCASTCTTFVERMKKQGVRSVVFGGRPHYGPMQAVGGVKGGQSLKLTDIFQYLQVGYELALNASKTDHPVLTPEQLKRAQEIGPKSPDDFPLITRDNGVNFRNQYREGDDVSPLQFVYEAAECRLFYTIENYISPATQWVAAARAMFGNGTCVQGSMGAAGSLGALPMVSN